MNKNYFVYILASKKSGTLYIGVTNDLSRRVWEHKQKMVEGFTKKYGLDKLVLFEEYEDVNNAIIREKQLKKWNRAWKIRLIEEVNSNCPVPDILNSRIRYNKFKEVKYNLL